MKLLSMKLSLSLLLSAASLSASAVPAGLHKSTKLLSLEPETRILITQDLYERRGSLLERETQSGWGAWCYLNGTADLPAGTFLTLSSAEVKALDGTDFLYLNTNEGPYIYCFGGRFTIDRDMNTDVKRMTTGKLEAIFKHNIRILPKK